jgi:hypothetical protein
LVPHRWRQFKLSNDPAFAEKVEDVVGLYVDPPEHAVVLSIDEKSQIQALDRTQPGLPMNLALIRPRLLAPLNRLWTKLGLLMFHVVNPVVMLLLFIVTIVPAGLIMRAVGHDPMRRRFDPQARSYWIERDPPGPPPDSLRNQF